ncbi:MAG: DUF4091 domain-containing protein [Verrucomicrobia bacterium]|nr:DUF4091 domain-containing protein [Verrucomicrobiota bacterium]
MKALVLFGALVLFAPAVRAAGAPGNCQVWVRSDTVHVLRDEPAGTGKNVALAAAKNEWESFQIFLRSDSPVKGVNIEPGDLAGPGGSVIRAVDAVLYRQHQVELTQPTYRNADFKPGWYPDALIPFRHPVTKRPLVGARNQAVPFDLPANETHGFWVDLFVPADAKPGKYRGACRVVGEGRVATTIAVELIVWDFELPRTPTFQTALGSPADSMRRHYAARGKAGNEPEPKDWGAVAAQVADELSRHLVNATPPAVALKPQQQANGTYRFTTEQVDALRKFVDDYHVNALQTPHPGSVIKDPEAEREKLHAWLRSFDQMAAELKRPDVIFFTYLKDEPNTEEDYHYVQQWGRAVRDAKSAVKVMVVEQPWTEPGRRGADRAWGDLYGAVDIWCPLFSLHRPEDAVKRQALGETIWTYTALCQGAPTPWWHIDHPLLNYRVPAWMAWRDQMKGLLYWGGMAYWAKVEDPWQQAPHFVGKGVFQQGQTGIVYHGEGSLVYPARAVGYDGIAPSIRLKALRDGIEDYEYLALLERAGRRAEAEKIVRPLTESFFKWEKDAAAYAGARAKLATMIVEAKRK